MVDQEAIKKIEELEKEYERHWGCKANYSLMPRCITTDVLAILLQMMIKSGDSLLVAYGKYKKSKE